MFAAREIFVKAKRIYIGFVWPCSVTNLGISPSSNWTFYHKRMCTCNIMSNIKWDSIYGLLVALSLHPVQYSSSTTITITWPHPTVMMGVRNAKRFEPFNLPKSVQKHPLCIQYFACNLSVTSIGLTLQDRTSAEWLWQWPPCLNPLFNFPVVEKTERCNRCLKCWNSRLVAASVEILFTLQ